MKSSCLLGIAAVLLVFLPQASAAVITYDEQPVLDLLGGSRWTSGMPSFSVSGLTFAAQGTTSLGIPPFLYLRSSWDDRSPSPSPYDFISGRMMQIGSTALQISFAEPVAAFGFGAALNGTSALSSMQVELFNAGSQSLGVFSFNLDRTTLSLLGGTNSNSEGLFNISSPGIASARITNFGDGINSASQYHWVIDNISYSSVPEPATGILVGMGIALVLGLRRRIPDGTLE